MGLLAKMSFIVRYFFLLLGINYPHTVSLNTYFSKKTFQWQMQITFRMIGITSSFIAPIQVNMTELEEGGMFDEETMPEWMRSMRGVGR